MQQTMRQLIRRFLSVGMVVILLGLLLWGWFYLRRPTTLPFRRVRLIYPTVQIDAAQVKRLVWEHIQGGFFSLKMGPLEKVLLNQPWVAKVSIRREWPDTLALSIHEKHAVARWGVRGVISAKADVFYPPIRTIPVDLPMIHALDRDQNQNQNKKTILFSFQQFNAELRALRLHIKTLTVTDRGVYQLRLSNGMPIMIGRNDVQGRFHRFVQLYPKIIAQKADQVVSIDLRYSNGLAVQWKIHQPLSRKNSELK